MKRSVILLLLLLLVVPVTGCKRLRELMRRCADNLSISVNRQGISVSVDCPFGAEESSPVQERWYKAASQLDRAIYRAAPTGGLDECGRICRKFGPDSDECDQCRSISGIAIMNPSILACAGTSYVPLPPTIRGGLRAETNRGIQYSPDAYTFSQDVTRIAFDGCGGERAEYTIQNEADRQAVRNWAVSLVDNGVRLVTQVAIVFPDDADHESLFRLKDDPSQCLRPDADPLRCGVFVGGFLFDSENGRYGFLSERMLPVPDVGEEYVFVGRGFLR